jgi:formylglycine-generating enzyme required for sulfatase activity
MVFVKGGTFQMGSNDGYSNEKPVHSITVDDFLMGRYQVTQKEWTEVMGSNPSLFKGDYKPVESVSWYDAVEFCNKKSELEGLQKCYSGEGEDIACDFSKNGYRLPTEAEWEYAARGGNLANGLDLRNGNKTYYKYSGSNTIDDVAWYSCNSGNKTHPVGRKQANELGIYDMSGNVCEWCYDRYVPYYNDSYIKQRSSLSSRTRINKGGAWIFDANNCRVAFRDSDYPDDSFDLIGFRLVRSAK